jgi:hypothetical protein
MRPSIRRGCLILWIINNNRNCKLLTPRPYSPLRNLVFFTTDGHLSLLFCLNLFIFGYPKSFSTPSHLSMDLLNLFLPSRLLSNCFFTNSCLINSDHMPQPLQFYFIGHYHIRFFFLTGLVTPFPIGLYSFPIVGTDRIENTAALLLPCIATLFTESSLQTL